MHKLLRRQLARIFGGDAPVPDGLEPLVRAVSAAYRQFDDDKDLLERSLELSSDELLQKNSEMRAVFQAFPDSFFWLDAEGRVLDYRGGRSDAYNFPPQSVIGRRIFEVPICAREDLFSPAVERAARSRQGVDFEYAVPIGGRQQHYEARLVPLFHGRLIAVVRNISRRKRDEQALRRGRDELERRVAERTAELVEANRVLKEEVTRRVLVQEQLREAMTVAEQASQAKSNFLSMVSHELRTPLTSVVGFAKMIRKQLSEHVFPFAPGTDRRAARAVEQVEGNIDIIISEGDRLTALINDVLDIAKLEAGKMEFRMEPHSVAHMTKHAASATRSLFEDKGLEYRQEIPAGLPDVLGDRDRIIQVLINLLSNAVKFTASGRVTCRAEALPDAVRISVEDTGCGLGPEDVARIFDKFQQLGDTLTDRPRGTGLGLTICRQIVTQHGGSIEVDSAPGRGSTFSFTLPAADAMAP